MFSISYQLNQIFSIIKHTGNRTKQNSSKQSSVGKYRYKQILCSKTKDEFLRKSNFVSLGESSCRGCRAAFGGTCDTKIEAAFLARFVLEARFHVDEGRLLRLDVDALHRLLVSVA